MGPPEKNNDCATKEYVDVYCRPMMANITGNTTAINGLRVRTTECEGKLAESKTFF